MIAPRRIHGPRAQQRQRGIALAVALVFLLLLSLLGVSAMQTSTLQERMAGNERDRGVAFEAAEAGLRVGEAELRPVPPSPFDNSDGLYTEGGVMEGGESQTPTYKYVDWSDDSAVRTTTVDFSSEDVRYIIVRLDPVGQPVADSQTAIGERQFYRITARGSGTSGDSDVFLQSTFRTQ